jgi:uncharacterized Zn finger protein
MEARSGGCSEELWFELARARERDHPADAIPIYRRRIDATVARMGDRAYAEGVRLIRRLRDIYERAGEPDAFTSWVRALRETHRRKRSFIAKLDKAGL